MEESIIIDKYGYLTVPIESYCENYEDEFTTITMNDRFFRSNFKKNEDGTYSLELNGKYLFSKIKRYFQNWDVPYLSIFLSKNPKVTMLNLSCNKINSAGFTNLIEHTNNHIIELDLQYNQISGQGIKYMLHNADKLKLKVLKLNGNKIGVKDAKMIAMTVLQNSFIQHLEVADIDQAESSLIYFTTILRSDQAYYNATLKVLDLSRPSPQCIYSKLNTSDLASVIGLMLRYNTTLDELYLRKYSFSCHDIEEILENAKYNKTLKLLDLSCNNIGDHGVNAISQWLEKRPSLHSLLLAHNIVSNHGARALSRGVPFSKLLVFDISHNRFDDEGCIELLHSIKKSPLLKVFHVYGNNIGHETAKIMKRMLLSGVLQQEGIDVKMYEDDGIMYFAYNRLYE